MEESEPPYSEELCMEKFRKNRDQSQPAEENKTQQASSGGQQQLWDIGFISSDWKEDRDDDEVLEDEDDLY